MGRPAKVAPGPEPVLDPDELVEVMPAVGFERPTARALLDAAERVGRPVTCVESQFGGFRAPRAVIDATEWPDHPYDGRGFAPPPDAALMMGVIPAVGLPDPD